MFAGWFLRGGGATSPEQARAPRRRAPPGRRGDPGSASREAPRSATRSPARAVCWRSAPRWSPACVAEVVGRGGPPLASVQRWPCCAEGSLSTLSWRRGWGLQPGFYESPGGERWSRCHQGASLGGRPEPGSGLRLCRQARQRLVLQPPGQGLSGRHSRHRWGLRRRVTCTRSPGPLPRDSCWDNPFILYFQPKSATYTTADQQIVPRGPGR